MPTPTQTKLNPSTVNRKWVLEVNTGTISTPTWHEVEGIRDFQPVTDNANFVDDSDFASQGYTGQLKVSTAWSATCTVRQATVPGTPNAYPVGQTYLESKSVGVVGPANTVQVRFYEYDPNDTTGIYTPRQKAFTGSCGVGWAEQGGGQDAPSTVQVTLTGQGQLLKITHPFPATP